MHLDDILLTGSPEAERLHHLQEVLARLEKAGIRLKRDNVTQLRSFSGLINYYSKFPPHSLSLLAPLYQLLQKAQRGYRIWGEAQTKAFREAKEALKSSKVLTHYDPDQELILDCDASPYGVEAVQDRTSCPGRVSDTSGICQQVTSTSRKEVCPTGQGSTCHHLRSEEISSILVRSQIYHLLRP